VQSNMSYSWKEWLEWKELGIVGFPRQNTGSNAIASA
jgi:hypothetical protein